MDELIRLDKDFSEAKFKTKVDNVFVKLHLGIMKQDIEGVKHFISNEVYNKYLEYIKYLNENNYIKMYDELNVASTNIQDISIRDSSILIKVCIKSRYMDYIVDKSTRTLVLGNNSHRIEKMNYLTFEKKITNKNQDFARKCPGCGANVDVNNSGKCSYCGTIYNLKDYDYILVDIKN